MGIVKRLLVLSFIAILSLSVWGADVNMPTSGSTYRFKATVSNTSYYLVAPTSTGIGTVSTTESDGTIFTFTQQNGNWYITFTSGNTTYYMYESGSNGQVSISTTKTKVNTITTNGNYTKIGGSKWIQFNNAANPKRMGCYSSSQVGVMLSPASSCTTTLSTPTVTSIAGDKQITLTWASITNASSYSVTCSGGGTVGAISGTTTKSCTITGLTNGTEYSWKVKAIGTGIYCDSEEAAGNTTPTALPINVTLYYKGTSTILENQTNPYTLPTTGTYVADACDAWTFDGWYGSSYTKSTTKPASYITELTTSGNAYAVYKHTEGGGEESFNPTNTSANGWTNTRGSQSATIGNFTVSTDDGICSSEIRTYSGSDFTVSTSIGKITSISFTPSSGYYISNLSTTKGSISGDVWTGNESSVTFSASSQVRFDQITVSSGNVYYSTEAECGPKVQATASPWVTSTQGATVKVEVPVTATNFDANCTLSASVSNLSFSIVGWGANGNSVTAGEDLTTSLILEYNPTIYSSDATITFNSTYSGSQIPVYTPGTVHGRSLPGLFVIAIKNGGTWYALPADMSGSGTYAGVAVDVNDIDNPTKVTAGPATALYRLMGVHPGRYNDYGTRVRFMSEYNSKCLWSNQANGGTSINNGAIPLSANSDNYEWTLVTTDGVTYAINTNVAKKIEEGRELRYYAGESRFGMYASGNSSFRLLPVDCWTRATVSDVSTTYNSVTLTWAGKSGTSYNVYIDEGGVTKKTETDVTSPVTISGLSPETNYTWIISPGAKDNGCALSGDFTTNVAPINVTLSCDGTEYHLGPQDKPYTLPTTGTYVADACAEWKFVGWTNGTYDKNTSAPTLITQMTADGTAYAVYKKTEGGGGSEKYVRVTATGQITDGQYLIMCNSYGDADDDTSDDYDYFTAFKGSLTTLDATYNSLTNIKRDIVEDTIGVTSTTTANEFTINANSHTIQSASGYYIGRTGSSNGLNSSTTTQYTNTMTIDGSGNFICKGSGGNVYLQFYSADERFRYFTSTQKAIQLYKRTAGSTYYYATSSECCNEVAVPTVVVEPVDVSATISWDNQSGAVNGYNVTCSNGTDQDVAAGVTSLVISGLSASTSYDYTVTAKGATCNRTFEGSFTTSSCSDVPTDVIVTPGTHTANIRWTTSAATATIVIYDDEQGTSIVTSVTNQTSPCTISGLNDNTNYYLQVLAGGSCPLPTLKPFTTQSTAVSIAEWFPDGININLNADEASATVLIEDKQEKATASTSYADDIFFSKYFEAASNVKLIAIYNGTNHDVNLSDYQLGIAMKTDGSSHPFSYYNFRGGTNPMKYVLEDDYNTKLTFTEEQLLLTPGTEIIFISYQNNNEADAAITQCARENPNSGFEHYYRLTTPFMQFNGDDAVALFDPSGNMIDLIGAGTKAGGLNTSSLVAASGSDGNVNGFMDNPGGWYTENGYQVTEDNGENPNYKLSTNRCLLIRRNHVKSGADAIARNLTEFLTLGDYTYLGEDYEGEWRGLEIPGHSGSAGKTASCNGFNEVGSYDYNAYYAKFDSITSVEELSGNKKEDGTYWIPIPQLDTLSCTMLRVKVYEGTEEKASAEYKVPIMVEGSKMTNDEVFKKHEVPTCKECDVVILKDAILEKTNGVNDRDEVRNLTIYPGGKLVVPSDKGDYTVQSVQFRVEKENAPLAKLIGNLITKDEQVIVSRRIKNDRYYFFSLPYDCNIADIHWANGEPATIGVDYQIVEYDGARRANEGSGSGVTPHWTPVSSTQLKAGVGYNIAVSSSLVKELIFPMAIGGTNLTNIENTKTAKTVAIHQYTNAGTTINNHNWNLVAHPYVSAFEPYSGDKITAGILEYTEPASPGEQGTWEIKNTSNVYLTMPSFNNNAITYTQTLAGDITSLDPFLAVFVQGAGEGDLTFEQTGRKLSAPARHLAAAAEDEDESIFVGVTLSGNGESDQTCVRIRPDFTDDYQLGYDLDKFVTFYTSRPQVYMKTPSYRLAFQAVSDEVAKSSFLPMGVYCYQAGTYTFGLNDRFPTDEVEAVYLFDKQTGVTTNLLYDTYSFSATKQVYTNTRFSLNVIVNRRAPQTATGMENAHAPNEVVRKILINGHVYIQRGGVIYDVTGKQMLNHK